MTRNTDVHIIIMNVMEIQKWSGKNFADELSFLIIMMRRWRRWRQCWVISFHLSKIYHLVSIFLHFTHVQEWMSMNHRENIIVIDFKISFNKSLGNAEQHINLEMNFNFKFTRIINFHGKPLSSISINCELTD